MSSEKTSAIVLRVVEYSETSCIITLFTQTSGKISGLAKGARRPKGPFHGAIDILSISQVMFLPRRGANLDLLTEAKLLRRFRPCQWSLARLYAGYYISELLLETLEPHSAIPELYDLTVATLDDLQLKETEWQFLPASSILLRYEMQLLTILGHQLGLHYCGVCGTSLSGWLKDESIKKLAFSLLESSLLCPKCRSGRRQLVEVNRRDIATLRHLQNENSAAWRENASDAVSVPLRDLLDQIWRVLLNKRLKLQPAIRQIVSKERRQNGATA